MALAAQDSSPAGFQPGRYIGYWHDGSGVVRDATPVTTSRDFVYKPTTITNKRGKKKEVYRSDRSTGPQRHSPLTGSGRSESFRCGSGTR